MEDVVKDYAALKVLLMKERKKKVVQHKFSHGKSSLHILCASGDVENTKSLIKHKANPTTTDQYQRTPLHLACENGNLDLISYLLPISSVNSKCTKGNTPLHILVGHHSNNQSTFFSVLERIKNLGANLNERNNLGNTPLHSACLKGFEKNAMWLIREGADVNIVNLNGENALHCAVFSATLQFISLLIGVGASLEKKGEDGCVREYAMKAGRDDIVKLIDENMSITRFSVANEATIAINGRQFSLEQLKAFRSRLDASREVSESKSPRFRSKISPVSGVEQKISQKEMLKRVVDINCSLLDPEQRNIAMEPWQGIIRFPAENECWVSEYCCIDKGCILPYRSVPYSSFCFREATAIHVFSENQSRFAIQQNQDSPIAHFAAKHDLVLKILMIIVHTTNRAIEFVDSKPLSSFIEEYEKQSVQVREKPARGSKPTKRRRSSLSYPTALLGGSKISSSNTNSVKLSLTTMRKPQLDEKGRVLCTVDFRTGSYGRIFSSHLSMEKEKDFYVFTSGSLEDVILYCLLHSGIRSLSPNQDVKSFYLSYYRFCDDPDELLSIIESTWETYIEAKWPFPYDGVSNDTTLYMFLKGFIESQFVLTDFEREMNFRESLASLYGKLIPKPKSDRRTLAKLLEVVHNVKQSRTKTSISQLCDLNSLLGNVPDEEAKKDSLDVLATPVDHISAQIISVNADLYKQLQIVELLDLRYQKNKENAVAINKVHNFSNKIYLLVPSTILAPDDPQEQKEILKKWIQISENVFHLRDYNSAIQIVNGITESSVMRLPHLKSLSPKWIERFTKVKEAFDPEGSFSRYRKLSMEAPSIPFVGVALKDLVFACEASPDRVESGGINFQKLRIIHDIIRSLKIEQPHQIDYSFLHFDPQIAQSILNANPLTQDELYERSKAISEALAVPQVEQVIAMLKKENKELQEELKQLKQENEQKDQLIATLMKQIKIPEASPVHQRTISTPSLSASSPSPSSPSRIRFA